MQHSKKKNSEMQHSKKKKFRNASFQNAISNATFRIATFRKKILRNAKLPFLLCHYKIKLTVLVSIPKSFDIYLIFQKVHLLELINII